jgi:hypothetical protein
LLVNAAVPNVVALVRGIGLGFRPEHWSITHAPTIAERLQKRTHQDLSQIRLGADW